MDDDAVLTPAPPNMAWLLTFADLVSLLITFFVLLYSMKEVDQSRWDVINGSFQGVFAVQEALVFQAPTEFKNADVQLSFQGDSLPYLETLLHTEVKYDDVLSKIETSYDERTNTLTIQLPTMQLFQSNSWQLTPQGKVAVAKLADHLRHWGNRMQVAGYAEPVTQPSADVPTAWELGMRRALTVVQSMYQRGVQSDIPAVSYGDSAVSESVPGLTIAQRAAWNRRVEVIVFGDKASAL